MFISLNVDVEEKEMKELDNAWALLNCTARRQLAQ